MTTKAEAIAYGKKYERPAAELLAAKVWPGSVLAENPTFSHIDFAVVLDKKWVGMLEVKKRTIPSTQYPTTAVNFEKHNAAVAAKKYFGIKQSFCLIVFNDRAGYFDLTAVPDGEFNMVRRDRGGNGSLHALYKNERFVWVDGLVDELESFVNQPVVTSP